MKAVFDSCILIDYLNGITLAKEEIQRFDVKIISIITYIEIMVGLEDIFIAQKTENFLKTDFEIISVHQEIGDLSISARKIYNLKVPDAIIFGTAQFVGALLVTRDAKDFPSENPIVRVPYKL